MTTMSAESPDGAGLSPAAPPCAHHWVLEESPTASARGRCRCCGQERVHSGNWLATATEHDIAFLYARELFLAEGGGQ